MTDSKEQNIAIFKDVSGTVCVQARLVSDTLWLSLNQLVELFGRDKSVISRHLKKIFDSGELVEEAVVANYATTATDGKTYNIEYYNLDAVISVGYRVNSKRGIEFRKWANNVLKDHLVKGYTINRQRLQDETIEELKQTIDLLSGTLVNRKLVDQEGAEILYLIQSYAKTWNILVKYDEDSLNLAQTSPSSSRTILYEEAVKAIKAIKQDLIAKGEASNFFGSDRTSALKGIIGNIYQTFDGNDLHPSFEEKAANLIYLVIKDHPFVDGNKRIACLLFLLLLKKNDHLLPSIPSPEGLTALAILIAESKPDQKELIIKLVTNLISKNGK